jgi:phosphoribosylaminoimidazole (AIR) synthetase
VPSEQADAVVEKSRAMGQDAWIIGRVTTGENEVFLR